MTRAHIDVDAMAHEPSDYPTALHTAIRNRPSETVACVSGANGREEMRRFMVIHVIGDRIENVSIVDADDRKMATRKVMNAANSNESEHFKAYLVDEFRPDWSFYI